MAEHEDTHEYEAPYRIQTWADGFRDRVSILDAQGAELMRLRHLNPQQVAAFEFFEQIIDGD